MEYKEDKEDKEVNENKEVKENKIDIENKECLICLESIKLEVEFNNNKKTYEEINDTKNILSLPCNCAGSIYHRDCIIKMLISGHNKNFCPHCKQTYWLKFHESVGMNNTILPVSIENQTYPNETNNNQNNQSNNLVINEVIKLNYRAIIFHLVTNSISNIICLKYFIDDLKYNNKYRPLIWAYFFKLLFNLYLGVFSYNKINRVNNVKLLNNLLQIFLILILIFQFSKMNNQIYIVLFSSQLTFIMGDLITKLVYEYKIAQLTNRVEIF